MKSLALAAMLLTSLAACTEAALPPVDAGGGAGGAPGGSGGSDPGGNGGSATGGSGGSATGGSGGSIVRPECLADSDCPAGTCVNGSCVADTCTPACTAGFECIRGACLPSGGSIGTFCSLDADCQAGLSCARSSTGEAICVRACGGGCPAGTECLPGPDAEGTCVPSGWERCAEEGLCLGGGVCGLWAMPAGPTPGCTREGGLGGPGTTCRAPTDCASGVCSPPGGAGGGRCTRPCDPVVPCASPFGACLSQTVSTPAGAVTADTCETLPVLGRYGQCCRTNDDCDPSDSFGCVLQPDGAASSCSAAFVCEVDDDCYIQLIDGACVDGPDLVKVCVALACF